MYWVSLCIGMILEYSSESKRYRPYTKKPAIHFNWSMISDGYTLCERSPLLQWPTLSSNFFSDDTQHQIPLGLSLCVPARCSRTFKCSGGCVHLCHVSPSLYLELSFSYHLTPPVQTKMRCYWNYLCQWPHSPSEPPGLCLVLGVGAGEYILVYSYPSWLGRRKQWQS